MDQIRKRYKREFFFAMAVYVVAILLSVSLIEQTPRDSVLRFLLAVAPIVPIFFALVAFLRFLNDIDELQQRIQLQAIGFAAGAVSLLTFAYGLLENAGLPQLSYIWILPTMSMLWGFGEMYFSRKYK